MATSKRTRAVPETMEHEAPIAEQATPRPEEMEALMSLLPSDAEAPRETEPEQPLPAFAQEEPVEEAPPDPGAEPLPKEYLVLAGTGHLRPCPHRRAHG